MFKNLFKNPWSKENSVWFNEEKEKFNTETIQQNISNIRNIKMIIKSAKIGIAHTWTYPYDDGKIYEIPTYQAIVKGIDSKGVANSKQFEVIRFGVTRKSANSASLPYTVGLAEKQNHIIKQWLPNYSVHSGASTEVGAWQVYGNFLIHDGPDNKISDNYASIGCIEICNGPKGFDLFNDYLINLSGVNGKTRMDKLANLGNSSKFTIEYEAAVRPPIKVV